MSEEDNQSGLAELFGAMEEEIETAEKNKKRKEELVKKPIDSLLEEYLKLEKFNNNLAKKNKDLRNTQRTYLETLRKLGETNDSLTNKLSQTMDELEKYKSLPNKIGYLEDITDKGLIVRVGKEQILISNPGLSKSDIGKMLSLSFETMQIVNLFEKEKRGKIGTILERLGKEKYVLGVGADEKKVLEADRDLKVGAKIEFDEDSFRILDELPNIEAKKFFVEKLNVKYNDIGGLGEQIERIKEVLDLPYKYKELYDTLKLEKPSGILLYGPPGCGKTHLARAIAGENDMKFLRIKGPEIFSMWFGESEKAIREIFEAAKKEAPSIIFFDEIDAISMTRSGQETTRVYQSIVTQLLTEFDGFDKYKDVYIIGATNRLDMVDPALLRPGRFSEIIEIPRPNRIAGSEIIEVYLKPDTIIHKDTIGKYGNRESALKGIKETLLDELYLEKWILTKDGKEMGIKRKDVVCGDIIKSIINKAKRETIKRIDSSYGKAQQEYKANILEALGEGLREDDIVKYADQECREHALTEQSKVFERMKDLEKKDDIYHG